MVVTPLSVVPPLVVGAVCAVTVIVEILPPVSEVVVAMEVVAIVAGWPAVYRLIRKLSAA